MEFSKTPNNRFKLADLQGIWGESAGMVAVTLLPSSSQSPAEACGLRSSGGSTLACCQVFGRLAWLQKLTLLLLRCQQRRVATMCSALLVDLFLTSRLAAASPHTHLHLFSASLPLLLSALHAAAIFCLRSRLATDCSVSVRISFVLHLIAFLFFPLSRLPFRHLGE